MLLDLILLNAACANGQCPQQTVTLVQQPAVVAVAQAVPGKTKVVTQYKRGLFGQMRPVYSTVSSTIAATTTASGNCAGGKCNK